MIFFPAIDLKNGQCVRLLRGDMNKVTVFSDDPVGQAAAFAAAGCRWLHVVDLDGAFKGKTVNGEAVAAIINAIEIPLQLGGGIRTPETIAYWLDKGVRRVILGTAALRDPDLVKTACREWPGRVAVGIDCKRGKVAVQGWAEVSEIEAHDLAMKFEDAGVAAIVYTDIGRDGAMAGPNVSATVGLAKGISTRVIASGGVSSLADLAALKRQGDGILEGVISGRAVYDGRIDPGEATRLLAGAGSAD
jgi:phosphoribosylformimino-5-aminoimidazole carboxamide ribotide isomerase